MPFFVIPLWVWHQFRPICLGAGSLWSVYLQNTSRFHLENPYRWSWGNNNCRHPNAIEMLPLSFEQGCSLCKTRNSQIPSSQNKNSIHDNSLLHCWLYMFLTRSRNIVQMSDHICHHNTDHPRGWSVLWWQIWSDICTMFRDLVRNIYNQQWRRLLSCIEFLFWLDGIWLLRVLQREHPCSKDRGSISMALGWRQLLLPQLHLYGFSRWNLLVFWRYTDQRLPAPRHIGRNWCHTHNGITKKGNRSDCLFCCSSAENRTRI